MHHSILNFVSKYLTAEEASLYRLVCKKWRMILKPRHIDCKNFTHNVKIMKWMYSKGFSLKGSFSLAAYLQNIEALEWLYSTKKVSSSERNIAYHEVCHNGCFRSRDWMHKHGIGKRHPFRCW